jgi:hypothetical protein
MITWSPRTQQDVSQWLPIRRWWNDLRQWWSQLSGVVIAAGGLFLVAGLLSVLDWGWPYPAFFSENLIEFHQELGTELVGIGATVLVIDAANRWRDVQQEKKRLINQMGSAVRVEACRAVEELRRAGWLEDGSVRGRSYWGPT